MPSPISEKKSLRSRFWFPLVAIALGLALALGLVEFVLRVAGFSVGLMASRFHTPPLTFTPDEFRIVCLGESTTDDFGHPETNWCGMLETKLNAGNLGRKFVTINRGRTSAMTTFLVDRMISELDDVKPSLVISMMGINDNSTFEYLHPDRNEVLRLVTVAKWLRQSMTSPTRQAVLPDDPEFRRSVEKRLAEASAPGLMDSMADIEAFRAQVFDLSRASGDRGWLVDLEGSRALRIVIRRADLTNEHLIGSIEAKRLAAICAEFADSAFQKNPTDRAVIQMVFFAGYRVPNFAIPRLKRAVELGYPLDDEIASFLAISGADRDPEVVAMLRNRGYGPSPSGRSWFDVTVDNYRRLADALRSNDIHYMAMQYPTGKLDILRLIFSDLDKKEVSGGLIRALYMEWPDAKVVPEYAATMFVSNENFSTIVTPENAKDYFADVFTAYAGGRFGHTTPKGHELIAQNAFDAIVRNWAQLSSK